MSNFTSLILSKKLADGGCELESRYFYGKREDMPNIAFYDNVDAKDLETFCGIKTKDLCPAFDILNDICVKYCVEFFGIKIVCSECGGQNLEYHHIEQYSLCKDCNSDRSMISYEYHAKEILEMLQIGLKQEVNVEAYIWQNTLFNKEANHGE